MSRKIRFVSNLASTTAVASMLLCPLAWSAPGDLDPAFGDTGRVVNLTGLLGDVRSIESYGDVFVFGGGAVVSATDPALNTLHGFTARMVSDGSIDPTYGGAIPPNLTVDDVVVGSDGRVTGVGRGFTAFRLTANGALDATFGEGGFAHAPADAGLPFGASVVLDDSGRAVIAGTSGRGVAVFRLLPNGEFDGTFGDAGVFTWSDIRSAFLSQPRLLRVPGGYRVLFHGFPNRFESPRPVATCWVVALRDDGVPDTTFGGSVVAVSTAIISIRCAAMAAQPDGGLVIAGTRGGPFAIRLLASGERDAGFNADEATAQMSGVTAMTAASDGSLLMAGRGDPDVPGSLVVKLRADGMLDASFGNAGTTWIDLPSLSGLQTIHDIVPLAGGDIVLAGGVPDAAGLGRPFVARLLGDSGTDGPGVVGVKRLLVDATANPSQAVVAVRRIAGHAGAISVAYRTRTNPDAALPAAEGQDYVATSGRLTWADQDSGDKEIVVQLLGDIDGNPENDRTFEVQLSDVQGGGLGSAIATVNTGYPAAIVQFDSADFTVTESQGSISLNVRRDNNVEGAIAVTLTAAPGTATAGSDFRFDATTVEWADGDSSIKTVTIPIVDDDGQEPTESFRISITSATSDAVIGDFSVTSITINDDDPGTDSGGGQASSSGGGSVGFLSQLLLSLAGVFRAVHRRLRRNPVFQKE